MTNTLATQGTPVRRRDSSRGSAVRAVGGLLGSGRQTDPIEPLQALEDVRDSGCMVVLRRVLMIGAVLSLLVVAAVAGLVLKVKADHPRDEAGFLDRMDRSAGKSPIADVDPDFVLAQGDQACAWLREQPLPLWRGDLRYTFYEMEDRYQREHPVSRRAWSTAGLTPRIRGLLVTTAWMDLCGAAREFRRTPFNDKPTD